MSGHLKAVIVLLIVGSVAIIGFRIGWPTLQEQFQRETSDAAGTHTVIRLGMDNWVGYFPLCSAEMKRRLRNLGIQLKCEDDQADYRRRFQQLSRHTLDLAVSTVDAYLLNGGDTAFPGVIISVIDESKGGDAIVSRSERVDNLNDLREGNPVRIAFTPGSPSEHLLKSVSVHFDLPRLRGRRGNWREETSGSSDALDHLLKGKVDVAVLWEPDVSKALAQPGIQQLISTADTDKLIVDVLLADRTYLRDHPEVIKQFLQTYFDVLKFYRLNAERLREELRESTGLQGPAVEAMLGGVAWAGLTENAVSWFGDAPGFGGEALLDAIHTSLDVLLDNGDFDASPLPNQDPYHITNRQVIDALYKQRNVFPSGTTVAADSLQRDFDSLDEAAWARMQEIGTLRIPPISFRRGSGNLDPQGSRTLDQVASRLRRYPNFRIEIRGHTGLLGEPQANLDLSADRARAVAGYLLRTYQIDSDRIHSVGFGSSRPLARLEGESDRAYSYRLPRVEIGLLSEDY